MTEDSKGSDIPESTNDMIGFKITSLLSEYREIRVEARTIEVLEIIYIFLSVLTFIALFTIAILSTQYILLFISPVLSILFIILAIAMFAYTTNLGIRASQVEGQLKKIIGETTIQWESTVGVFGGLTQRTNIFTTRIGKQWLVSATLAIVVGLTPVVFSLWYWFEPFYREYGFVAWIVICIDIGVIISTIYFGSRILFKPAWRQ